MVSLLSQTYQDLQTIASENHLKYKSAEPFPNIYFDDFFNPDFLNNVALEFKISNKENEVIHYQNPNENKYASVGESSFGAYTKQLAHFLNSQPFLEFLQKLTGISESLIPDPYFDGGGFHEIKPGGFLKLHVDFYKNKKTNLDRRLNVLIYLNKDWDPSYGGDFELWEKDMSKQVVKIAPLFNRLAMFTTTGNSWHGHPDPLTCPEDRSRKSFAVYYYSNGRPANEIKPEHTSRITTTFMDRKGIDPPKMKFYNNLVNFANEVLPPFVVKLIKRNRIK